MSEFSRLNNNEKTNKFVNVILNWYNTHKRSFPWRNTNEPYVILLTEILLRRTTAKKVNSIYKTFFEKYPNLNEIYKSNISEIQRTIEPLGLAKQRSNQIKNLSEVIINQFDGKIPSDYKSLLKLPGVGKYTAGAVMCLSYGKKEPMVDKNVTRLIQRFFGLNPENCNYSNPEVWKFIKDLIPVKKCKEFNLGIIDFASCLCKPKNPNCEKCSDLGHICDKNIN